MQRDRNDDPNNKRQCTPSKVRTPKRKKVTPYTPDRNTIPLGNSPQNFFTESISEVDSELVQRFLVKMRENGHYEDFIKFMKCAITGTFPLDNLSFVLFMKTVRFLSASNTLEMRYSEISKLFWKTGYRLFHAKFLNFIGGPKNIDLCLNVFEQKILHPNVILHCDQLQHPSAMQHSLFQLISMIL